MATDPKSLSPEVRQRQAVERRIVRAFVSEMLAAGFSVEVANGEDEKPKSKHFSTVMNSIMETDEERIYVYRGLDAKPFAWAFFVYGNSGWDVLSDYTTNLETLMPRTLALIDKLS